MSTNSLQELVDKIDWLSITSTRAGYNIRSKLTVLYLSNKNNSSMKVKVKISPDLMSDLEWSIGDTIYPKQSPDNLKAYMLCKNPGGTGYKLSSEGGGRAGIITFPWTHTNVILQPSRHDELEHIIHTGRLFFQTK